ncbi:MAG: formate/nitrite transporter family protein [Lachnospiraceae bacterium]|nr:formate/nitrite transporter family protein [Lachnospiraceae bacterium]
MFNGTTGNQCNQCNQSNQCNQCNPNDKSMSTAQSQITQSNTLTKSLTQSLQTFSKSISAGICILLGCVVNLSLSSTSKIAGAILFSVGLFAICSFGLNLYTGKAGHLLEMEHKLDTVIIWIGNFVGAFILGILVSFAKQSISSAAYNLMITKIHSLSYINIAVSSICCGMLMYIAVDNFKSNKNTISGIFGIVFCVTVFILSGFEHSIADIGYFGLAFRYMSLDEIIKSIVLIFNISLFNAIGSIVLHYLVRQNSK